MYHLSDYGRMFADTGRTEAYMTALRAAITPGAVVLDLGAGSGFFTLAACQLGAARVYAVDVAPAIDLLPRLAAANGYGDRVIAHRGDAFAFRPPEPIDVLVSDLRGNLPLFAQSIALLAHARDTLLRPGGALLPYRDRLYVAPVEAPAAWSLRVGGYHAPPLPLDLRLARDEAASEYHNDRGVPFQPEQLLAAPSLFATLTYADVTPGPLRGAAAFTASRAGTCHGFALWFDAEIAPGVGYSNAPGEDHVYGRVFFAWPEPVSVAAGDAIAVSLFAQPTRDSYVWGWTSTVGGQTFRQVNPVPIGGAGRFL